MSTALLVTAIVAAAIGFSLREAVASTPFMWLGLGVPYLALAAFTLHRFHDQDTLRDKMRLRGGDFTIGFLIALVLLGGAYAVRHVVLGSASPKMVWLLRIALSLGGVRPSPASLALVAAIGALEEIVWRGLVLEGLRDSLGPRRAWPAAAVLYAAAHAPTLITLRDPFAGPNPLLVIAALGAGLVWSFAASMFGRLPPVIISHAIFSYFAASLLLSRLG